MKKINITTLLSIFIDIVFIIFLYIIFSNPEDCNFSKLKALTLFSFITFCILLCFSIIKNKNLIDFYKIFLLFYIVYIFGLVFLRYIFNYEVPEVTMYIDDLFSYNCLYDAELFSILCLLFIDLGYNVFFINKRFNEVKINDFPKNDISKNIKIIGYSLFIFSFLFAISELIETFKLVEIMGYKGQYTSYKYGLASIPEKIVPYFVISIYILMISYKNDIKKVRIFLGIGSIYCISLIFLGSRGLPLLNFLGMIIIYISIGNNIQFKNTYKIFIILFIITILISILRENRDKPFNEWKEEILQLVVEKIYDNPINESIYEMGMGIYPIASSIKLVPTIIEPLYGKSYLQSFNQIINLNFGNAKKDKNSYNAGVLIGQTEGIQYGSSFIEEIYCNFQWYGLLFAFLIGLGIAWFSYKYHHLNNILFKVLYIKIFIEFTWCIRNVLLDFPRIIAFYIIPIVLLYYFLEKRRKYEKNLFNHL